MASMNNMYNFHRNVLINLQCFTIWFCKQLNSSYIKITIANVKLYYCFKYIVVFSNHLNKCSDMKQFNKFSVFAFCLALRSVKRSEEDTEALSLSLCGIALPAGWCSLESSMPLSINVMIFSIWWRIMTGT